MAEGDITFFKNAKKKILDNELDWAGATTVKLMLMQTYTLDHTDEFISDVTTGGTQESGTGYTAGGSAIGTRSTSLNGNNVDIIGGNVTFSGLDVGTPAAAVGYVDTGTPATSPVIFYLELGTTASNGGDYTVDWSGSGVVGTLS